jgi:hypothetical protein
LCGFWVTLFSPLLLHDDDDIIEYSTDPELIYEKYEDLVDIVIDGGYGDNIASTVVDCTEVISRSFVKVKANCWKQGLYS